MSNVVAPVISSHAHQDSTDVACVGRLESYKEVSLAQLANDIKESFTVVCEKDQKNATVCNAMYLLDGDVKHSPFDAFIPNAVIVFYGLFTMDAAKMFSRQFESACAAACTSGGDHRVIIVLNSIGGNVKALLQMIDCLDTQRRLHPKLHIDMLAVECVCSCGMLFFMNADKCYVSAGTVFLQHQPWSKSGNIDADIAKQESEDMKDTKTETYDVAENGLFRRRIRLRNGFMEATDKELTQNNNTSAAGDSATSAHATWLDKLNICLDTIEEKERQLKIMLTCDMSPVGSKDERHSQKEYSALESEIKEKSVSIRDMMRKRWFEYAKPALDAEFGTTTEVDAQSFLPVEGEPPNAAMERHCQKNIFVVITETYARNPNNLYLSHRQLVNFGILTGTAEYTHIYKYTTITRVSIELVRDHYVHLKNERASR
jgi:ATP-dependent protease ClpP protease subunit